MAEKPYLCLREFGSHWQLPPTTTKRIKVLYSLHVDMKHSFTYDGPDGRRQASNRKQYAFISELMAGMMEGKIVEI